MVTLWKKIAVFRLPSAGWLLSGDSPRTHRWPSILWFAGLFLLGIFIFGDFFQWGGHTIVSLDWAKITAPRFQFLRDAIKTGQLPMHISDPAALHLWTTRYLSVADAFISPQFVLLYGLTIQRFNLVNVWLMYALGFAGMLVLRRRLRLSPLVFAALFLLFNFNGHVLGHYSVGHATWGGYFLLPWFVWLVLRLLDGDHSWRWTLEVAVLLFVIWLQGSFHHTVWLLMMLGLIGVFVRGTFWAVVRAGFFSVLICAFRILPVALLYGQAEVDFINGFPSLSSVWDNLVNLPQNTDTILFLRGLGGGLGSWEMTYFLGLVGGLFLLYFGVYRGLFKQDSPFSRLLMPLGILLLLSLGHVYELVLKLHIPLLEGERATTRIFSVVLVFGLVFAAERCQRWLEEGERLRLALPAGLLALGLIANDLWQNLNIWRIVRPEDGGTEFDPSRWFVQNDPSDTIYYVMVFGGLAITLLTFIGLCYMSWREKRQKNLPG